MPPRTRKRIKKDPKELIKLFSQKPSVPDDEKGQEEVLAKLKGSFKDVFPEGDMKKWRG